MRILGTFTLNVEPGSGALAPRVSIALVGAVARHGGVVHPTPTC